MDPARDFRALIKQKSLPFGEGEVQFFLLFFSGYLTFLDFRVNCYSSSSVLVIVFISSVVVTPVSSLVCQQLTHRIEQLLGNKNTHYYMKSITCIQAFREQSVKVNIHFLPFGKCTMMWVGSVLRVCEVISRYHTA